MTNPYKKAILLTGAAARISQEVAMLDQLMAHKGLVIDQDDTMLAGFSSGSLNVLALNGCFRKDQPLSWEDYYKKEVLWPLKTSDVFTFKLPPFNTDPLRHKLDSVLKKFGYANLEDLPFYSWVLTFSKRELETLWACSKNKAESGVILSDLFMSSTAIPVVFPGQKIGVTKGLKSDFPGGKFLDGGTGGQFKRFDEHLGKYVLDHGSFEEMYIISPMRAKDEDQIEDHLTKTTEKHGISLNLDSISLSSISIHSFNKFLKKLQRWNADHKVPLARNIYVSIPNVDENFSMLNFDIEKEEYDAVMAWANKNPDHIAMPLDEYISHYG